VDRLSAELTGAVIVVTGPPGAGKSTASGHLVTLADRGVLIDGDSFFTSVKTGWIEPWKPESGAQNETVIDALGAAASRYARGGYTVLVEGIVGPWFLERFRAEISGPLHYVVIRPNRNAAFARATARPAPRLNNPEAVTKMYDEFASLGVYERCVVDNSMQTLDETVDAIASGLAERRFRV
jgi:adenylate kinase family enzyme